MSNGKDITIDLIVGLIKKMLNEILSNASPLYKNESVFSIRTLVEILMSKLIYLIMQQNVI